MFALAWRGILDLLWPVRTTCLLCGGLLLAEEGLVCGKCWGAMAFSPRAVRCANCARPLTAAGNGGAGTDQTGAGMLCVECAEGPAFGRVFALGFHMGPLREAIHHLKFNGRTQLGEPLGRRLGACVTERPDCILAIPLLRSRLRHRGYNQALLIAEGIATELGVPLCRQGLIRQRRTGHQAKLDRTSRMANLRGAFAVEAGKQGLFSGNVAIQTRLPWAGCRVLLVDDVLTTGATASAAAEVLRATGATGVDLAVLAVSTVPVRAV